MMLIAYNYPIWEQQACIGCLHEVEIKSGSWRCCWKVDVLGSDLNVCTYRDVKHIMLTISLDTGRTYAILILAAGKLEYKS
jgi:hypothetical protein